ncbi:GLPGLI family protein [Mucilaginibacter myungsuensis]|uniref:GLPGLI family protein n=1 Tax=Mucilaginibacter myungsuensis TaxID=649104 RepID=A0A929KVN5_9SPHI|nr:GLPGLI family protein [Mucilaginibacter myungsuensis]MBE9661992.1 GLPGLI family protein [Mucilaginibacter myungsuensis]MDN3599575.1 GLPGLI family protein [Mucilaginibacter myungsuensis]
MKKLIIIIALAFGTHSLMAQQAHFTMNGTVEFERTINIYALIKKQMADNPDDQWMQAMVDGYKKNNPQFKKQKSLLTFSKDKSLFEPIEETGAQSDNFFWSAAPTIKQNNTTYTDLTSGLSVTQKKAFEEVFLLKDSTRKINWKITDEKRDIAGYNCRRANAIVMDSIYVVAFYTDDIPVTSGPEGFTGLPGMILGVAMPHDNITWFATKVTDVTIPENKIVAPAKGKVVDRKSLKKKLDESLDDWGSEGRSFLKTLML